MENKKIEKGTKRHNIVVGKLVYLAARRTAERHKVWWSKISVTEIGDPIYGMVKLEFTAKANKQELIERDIEYLNDLDTQVGNVISEGKRAIYMK